MLANKHTVAVQLTQPELDALEQIRHDLRLPNRAAAIRAAIVLAAQESPAGGLKTAPPLPVPTPAPEPEPSAPTLDLEPPPAPIVVPWEQPAEGEGYAHG